MVFLYQAYNLVGEARYECKKSGIAYGKIGCLQAVIIGSKVPRKGWTLFVSSRGKS